VKWGVRLGLFSWALLIIIVGDGGITRCSPQKDFMHLGFQYDIEYHPLRNEKGEKRRLEDRLQTELIAENGLRRLLTGVRGRLHTCGFIWHDERDLTQADMREFVEWARKQPIDGVVRLGPIEDFDTADFKCILSEIEFDVDQAPAVPLTKMGPMQPIGEVVDDQSPTRRGVDA